MADQQPETEQPIDFGVEAGRPFEDELLLAIIDAYPLADTSTVQATTRREERLRQARSALFGEPIGPGRPRQIDLQALRWMGQQHYNDKAAVFFREHARNVPENVATSVRSDRELSSQAQQSFYPGHQDIADRLRRKFSARREYWVAVAQIHDDVPEVLISNALQEIASILKRFDVEMLTDAGSRS